MANSKPTRVGKRGVQGAAGPLAGLGVSPHETLKGGELPPLTSQPRVGPKTLADPEPTGVGKTGGPGGRSPHGGGSWGVSPHKFKRGGELPTLAIPPRVGPKTPANPKPAGVGKGGWRGLRSLPGGMGDVPPRTKNKGRVANSCNQATSETQNVGEPLVNDGGKMGGPQFWDTPFSKVKTTFPFALPKLGLR